MALLANRVKSYNRIYFLLKLIFWACKRFFAVILICASLFLLYFSSASIKEALFETTGRILVVSNNIYQTASNYIQSTYRIYSDFQNLKTENEQLKLEIDKLRDIKESYSLLLQENNELRSLMNVVQDIENNSTIIAKVIANNSSPFTSLLIINAGYVDGVKESDVVRNKEGLIGRIINVSKNYATIMLINDINSRIPVITEASGEKGVLAKHNDAMKIIYTRDNHEVQVGEKIITSGEGKIYKRGIAIGEVIDVNNEGVFVKPSINMQNIDFVIIESGNFAQ